MSSSSSSSTRAKQEISSSQNAVPHTQGGVFLAPPVRLADIAGLILPCRCRAGVRLYLRRRATPGRGDGGARDGIFHHHSFLRPQPEYHIRGRNRSMPHGFLKEGGLHRCFPAMPRVRAVQPVRGSRDRDRFRACGPSGRVFTRKSSPRYSTRNSSSRRSSSSSIVAEIISAPGRYSSTNSLTEAGRRCTETG